MSEPEPELPASEGLPATHTTAAAGLPGGQFLALLPGAAASKAGVVFGDSWPQIKRVEEVMPAALAVDV